MQPRRVEPRPRRVEAACELARLHRRRDADRIVGGHQGGGRLRGQRGGTLGVGPRRREQRVDHLVRFGHALDDDQRVDAFAARVERELGRAGPVERVGGEAPALDLVRALRRFARAPRRRRVRGAGLAPLGRAGPMRRDAVWKRLAREQVRGDAPMEQPRDRLGHGLARRLEDEIVRERAVAQDLRRLELAPRLGDVERMRLEHRRGELGAELGSGERGDARQAQRLARQLRQAPFDERADADRLRQPRAVAERRGVAREQEVLQGLEREHRVAAGVPEERRREALDVELGQAERVDQRRELREVERLHGDRLDAPRLLERAAHLRHRRAGVGGPLREAPAQGSERIRLDERLDELDARVVGEVQVVDDHRVDARRQRVDERRVDGAVQQEPLRLARERDRRTQLRQDERELARPVRIERDLVLGEQGAQQPREHGVGDAFVARSRADRDHAGATGRELVQQPGLADSRFADEEERPLRRPRAIERRELALAADEARRPDQAGRNDGAARRQRRAAALDRRQQLDRLRRRLRAELVLEVLLEALERGDRRGAVAAQVVQPHQAALCVLGERIALDQALRIDEAARDRSALLARRRCGGERRVALLAPLAALDAQPLGELGEVVEVEVAEELASAGVLVDADRLERRPQVVLERRARGSSTRRRRRAPSRSRDAAGTGAGAGSCRPACSSPMARAAPRGDRSGSARRARRPRAARHPSDAGRSNGCRRRSRGPGRPSRRSRHARPGAPSALAAAVKGPGMRGSVVSSAATGNRRPPTRTGSPTRSIDRPLLPPGYRSACRERLARTSVLSAGAWSRARASR